MRTITWLTLCVAVGAAAGCNEAAKQSASGEAAPGAEHVEATAVAFNAQGAPTIAFSVPDMMCEFSCAPKVREILAAQPGVQEVKVELESKTATVVADETFDPEAAVAALVDVQFLNTTLATAAKP